MTVAENELLLNLVDRWLISLYESQRVALDSESLMPDDVRDGLLGGLEEQIALAERVRDKLKES